MPASNQARGLTLEPVDLASIYTNGQFIEHNIVDVFIHKRAEEYKAYYPRLCFLTTIDAIHIMQGRNDAFVGARNIPADAEYILIPINNANLRERGQKINPLSQPSGDHWTAAAVYVDRSKENECSLEVFHYNTACPEPRKAKVTYHPEEVLAAKLAVALTDLWATPVKAAPVQYPGSYRQSENECGLTSVDMLGSLGGAIAGAIDQGIKYQFGPVSAPAYARTMRKKYQGDLPQEYGQPASNPEKTYSQKLFRGLAQAIDSLPRINGISLGDYFDPDQVGRPVNYPMRAQVIFKTEEATYLLPHGLELTPENKINWSPQAQAIIEAAKEKDPTIMASDEAFNSLPIFRMANDEHPEIRDAEVDTILDITSGYAGIGESEIQFQEFFYDPPETDLGALNAHYPDINVIEPNATGPSENHLAGLQDNLDKYLNNRARDISTVLIQLSFADGDGNARDRYIKLEKMSDKGESYFLPRYLRADQDILHQFDGNWSDKLEVNPNNAERINPSLDNLEQVIREKIENEYPDNKPSIKLYVSQLVTESEIHSQGFTSEPVIGMGRAVTGNISFKTAEAIYLKTAPRQRDDRPLCKLEIKFIPPDVRIPATGEDFSCRPLNGVGTPLTPPVERKERAIIQSRSSSRGKGVGI